MAVNVASICCRIGSGALAACADARVLPQVFCRSPSWFSVSCSLVACAVSAANHPVASTWRRCQSCCRLCNASRVGSVSRRLVVAANCASNFPLNSGRVLAIFSICALGAALTVRLPSKLDTSVARVAISASGIATGGAGGGGSDSAALGGVGGFCSAAIPATDEREQNTTRANTNQHGKVCHGF